MIVTTGLVHSKVLDGRERILLQVDRSVSLPTPRNFVRDFLAFCMNFKVGNMA